MGEQKLDLFFFKVSVLFLVPSKCDLLSLCFLEFLAGLVWPRSSPLPVAIETGMSIAAATRDRRKMM